MKRKKQQTERVKKRNKKRVRDKEKLKTLEERKKEKTIIYQKYVHAGDTKINKKEKKK